jgi:hypothetical protein
LPYPEPFYRINSLLLLALKPQARPPRIIYENS